MSDVWGTFSVRDHCRREAFLREVLLFDGLVVPYPDPDAFDEGRQESERDRWYRLGWDPDGLDRMLEVLGTMDEQHKRGVSGSNNAQLVRRILWSKGLWDEQRVQAEVANSLTGDAYLDTRLMVSGFAEIPNAVETMAAYETEADWRDDVDPSNDVKNDVPASQALLRLTRPLLVPNRTADPLDDLRQAVDLATSESYRAMRAEYYTYFRELMSKLIRGEDDLSSVHIDQASLRWAEGKLRELWTKEKRLVAEATGDRNWGHTEYGCATAAMAGGVGIALQAALPVVGAGIAVLSFVGWALARWRQPTPTPTLSGASMFVAAARQPGWLEPEI